MASLEPLYADNDWDYHTYLEDIDQVDAHREAVTTGEVTAYIVGAANADAAFLLNEPIDAGLGATVTHVGVADPGDDDYPEGTWLVHFDRDALTRAVLDPLFAAPIGDATSILKPFVIVDDPAGARVVLPVKYYKSRAAVVGT